MSTFDGIPADQLPAVECRLWLPGDQDRDLAQPVNGALIFDTTSDDRSGLKPGTVLDNAIACFGPGTTAGGRAEAGWFELGTITEDGIVLTSDTIAELVEHQDVEQ